MSEHFGHGFFENLDVVKYFMYYDGLLKGIVQSKTTGKFYWVEAQGAFERVFVLAEVPASVIELCDRLDITEYDAIPVEIPAAIVQCDNDFAIITVTYEQDVQTVQSLIHLAQLWEPK